MRTLFTPEKVGVLAEALVHPNCKITTLNFEECRGKALQMSTLFKAIEKNKSVRNLSFVDMSIPLGSLPTMVEMLKNNKGSLILTLRGAGLTDEGITKLAEGFKHCSGLIYLDLRQNLYEGAGTKALLKSLTGNSALMTLRLNAI